MAVDPTKLIAPTVGSVNNVSTASLSPLTTFRHPFGNPASINSSAAINGADGSVKQGDNRNALAMTQAQDETHTMKQWEFRRGETTTSSLIETSIDDYYSTLMGSLGVKSRNIKNSKAYADVMVNKMTEQRNAVSAVSLDEEMVNLMKYQHAYSAASKLLKTTDEMLNTLISVR